MSIFKTGFFGYDNFKWILRELTKMYSGNETSFFSKKRIESGIAFIILQWGMIYWFVNNITVPVSTSSSVIHGISSSDLFLWASIEAVICGYTLSRIEKEKKENNDKSSDIPPAGDLK
jgi:hypothetical protein